MCAEAGERDGSGAGRGASPTLRIAVTGASGFVGGAIVRHLTGLGHEVLAYGRRDAARVPEWMQASYASWDIEDGPLASPPDVDAVVHCAGAVDDWGRYPEFHRANVDGTRNVLAAWPDARFVHISSGSIYDPHADHSHVVEEDADPADAAAIERVRWLNAYGRTKRMAEHVVATEAAGRGVILRPHAVYGPGDTQILPRLLRRYRFGKLTMAGHPDTRVSLTHIDNFCHGVACAVTSRATGAFNVCDPTAARLEDNIKVALVAAGRNPEIRWIPGKAAWAFAHVADATHLYGRLPRPIITRFQLSHIIHPFVMDISKARRELGYAPQLDAPDALATV